MPNDNIGTLKIGRFSDAGKVRELNEDCLGTPRTLNIDPQKQVERGVLVAVADGMGGYAAGEIASHMAIETLFNVFYAAPHFTLAKTLLAAFAEANKRIHSLAAKDATKTNMGSTLVAAALKNGKLYVANVGDSRAYLVRGNQTRQITRDHSWVAEQVRAGVLTKEQADQNAFKNIILRAVGSKPEVKADLFQVGLKSSDAIVLCSDGLSNYVKPQEIERIIHRTPEPEDAAKQLIDLANERGGEDNVTAIVVRVPKIKSTSLVSIVALGLALLAIAILLYVTVMLIQDSSFPSLFRIPQLPIPFNP